jgi:cell cycle arrest protein BUB2
VTENSLTRVLNAVAWKLHDAHEAQVNGWLSPRPGSMSSPPPTSASATPNPNSGEPPLNSSILSITSQSSQAGDRADSFTGYVQGMNVLAAPFLYSAKSESQAFSAFCALLQSEIPGYIRGSMEGVHRGLALVDETLSICDPKLATYLNSKGLNASIYAFPSVLTMCACTPPLPEVLQLWDFLLAYGVHLNILCIVAQLVLIRDQILGAER